MATTAGERTLPLGPRRRASGYDGLSVVDMVGITIAGIDGARGVALVTVTVFVAGEDDGWTDDTLVLVALRGRPRVLWVGPGDFTRSWQSACTFTRTTHLSVSRSTLRVRSEVAASLAEEAASMFGDPLPASVTQVCVAPRRVRADVALPPTGAR